MFHFELLRKTIFLLQVSLVSTANKCQTISSVVIHIGWISNFILTITSYILHVTLEIKNQMLLLVVSGANIMLSLGKQ